MKKARQAIRRRRRKKETERRRDEGKRSREIKGLKNEMIEKWWRENRTEEGK